MRVQVPLRAPISIALVGKFRQSRIVEVDVLGSSSLPQGTNTFVLVGKRKSRLTQNLVLEGSTPS